MYFCQHTQGSIKLNSRRANRRFLNRTPADPNKDGKREESVLQTAIKHTSTDSYNRMHHFKPCQMTKLPPTLQATTKDHCQFLQRQVCKLSNHSVPWTPCNSKHTVKVKSGCCCMWQSFPSILHKDYHRYKLACSRHEWAQTSTDLRHWLASRTVVLQFYRKTTGTNPFQSSHQILGFMASPLGLRSAHFVSLFCHLKWHAE